MGSKSDRQDLVLITGANGVIGTALAEALGRNFEVIGLDVDCEGAAFECLNIDITSDEAVDEALKALRERHGKRIAAVIHLAAYFDFTGEHHPLYDKVNVEGTRRLLRKLQSFEVERFVYSSTMLVHAPTRPGVPITEDSPIAPKWAYPESKAATERVIRAEHSAIPYAILRLAGMYTDRGGPPTLAHQIERVYERTFKSHLFAGDAGHGQSFLHIEDLIDAVVRVVKKRKSLPPELALMIGEPATMSYQALQNELGRLIHGEEEWETLRIPKPLAKSGAVMEDALEVVVPDAIDQGEKPFIKPFMVAMADDHFELDISRARELLGWEPKHSLRETIPKMVKALLQDPLGWYRENGLNPPQWLEELGEEYNQPERMREKHEEAYRREHRRTLWAHFMNMGMGSWLMTSPPILGYQSTALIFNDVAAGFLILFFAFLSLSWRMEWARWVVAGVGVWLLFAPLIFWAPTAAAYANDTLIGALVIGFAVLVRPPPGVGIAAGISGPDAPPGWDYSPSTWTQRMPIIILAFVGLYVSRYLAAYQLGHIDSVWEPFFAGGPDPKNGTEEIITSKVSEAWPVPDAGLGAVTYMLEILTGLLGSRRRWRTMPWLVILFGFMIVPLGGVSIFFIIIQPIVIGTWCTLCLIAAAAMLVQIPYSFDEILATCQFLYQRYREGKPVWRIFFTGDTMDGGKKTEPEDFEVKPMFIVKDMLGGGVNLPWTLVATLLIGGWLMCTRLTLGTEGAMANSDHLIGSLVITVTVSALAEVARPLRFINILFGVALLGAPWMFEGATTLGAWADVLAGVLLIGLNLPRGPVTHNYGGWNKYIF